MQDSPVFSILVAAIGECLQATKLDHNMGRNNRFQEGNLPCSLAVLKPMMECLEAQVSRILEVRSQNGTKMGPRPMLLGIMQTCYRILTWMFAFLSRQGGPKRDGGYLGDRTNKLSMQTYNHVPLARNKMTGVTCLGGNYWNYKSQNYRQLGFTHGARDALPPKPRDNHLTSLTRTGRFGMQPNKSQAKKDRRPLHLSIPCHKKP